MRSAELVGVAQTITCCGEVSRVSGRGQVAQRGVRPGLIIRNHPPCDGGAGVIEIIEERLVEKFVAHAAIECLADAVLHGLARRDEVPGYPILLDPCQHGVRGELGSVVGDDNAWSAAPTDQAGQLARYTVTGDRRVGDCSKAFLGHVIHHVQNAEASSAHELIVDEICGPTRIRAGLDEQRCPRSDCTLPATTLADCQTFLSIEALRLLPVHDMAFTAQEHVQTPVAEPPLLGSQFAQAKT